MTENQCAYCNEPIPKTKKYCNLSCAGKGGRGRKFRKLVDATCAGCPKVFRISESELTVRKFCSRSCSVSTGNSTSPNRPKRKQYSCKNCGGTTHNENFCTSKCAGLFKSQQSLLKFLEGSSKTLIKNAKIYDFLLERQNGGCAVCTMPPIWNGKPLLLIHDHIDGNSENNSPDNIRLVCSNCDSQLDTYKAKNVGNGRHYRRTRYAEGKSS